MLLFISMQSCDLTDKTYSNFISIQDSKWLAGEPVKFDNIIGDTLLQHTNETVKIPPCGDTAKEYTLSIRHDNSYPYRNIWLFIDYITTNHNVVTDTIELQLSDIYGQWYGKGFGNNFEYSKVIIPTKVKLQEVKNISIWQGMRCDTLSGITDIGISISKF